LAGKNLFIRYDCTTSITHSGQIAYLP